MRKWAPNLEFTHPGRTDTVVNDRLRRYTAINGDRTRPPYTMNVYGAKRQETDSVYGSREKIRRFWKVIFDTPFTEINGDKRLPFTVVYHRMWSYTIVVYITDAKSTCVCDWPVGENFENLLASEEIFWRIFSPSSRAFSQKFCRSTKFLYFSHRFCISIESIAILSKVESKTELDSMFLSFMEPKSKPEPWKKSFRNSKKESELFYKNKCFSYHLN